MTVTVTATAKPAGGAYVGLDDLSLDEIVAIPVCPTRRSVDESYRLMLKFTKNPWLSYDRSVRSSEKSVKLYPTPIFMRSPT